MFSFLIDEKFQYMFFNYPSLTLRDSLAWGVSLSSGDLTFLYHSHTNLGIKALVLCVSFLLRNTDDISFY